MYDELVPFDDVVEKISTQSAKQKLKMFRVQQESKMNVSEICLPEFKPGDDLNIHFERLASNSLTLISSMMI